MYIGSKEVRTGKKWLCIRRMKRNIHSVTFMQEKKSMVQAIEAALAAKESWANASWENRAGIF